ncbi:hypothetical protein [Pedobacter changchengzhani]|uniref:hypothetical protein n=1 Tax=Pedobacter changchengzhani TaxID=2529274 RepID=UPI0014053CD1|nr:hypothetical protein [Pedobacter changchengzhani]
MGELKSMTKKENNKGFDFINTSLGKILNDRSFFIYRNFTNEEFVHFNIASPAETIF